MLIRECIRFYWCKGVCVIQDQNVWVTRYQGHQGLPFYCYCGEQPLGMQIKGGTDWVSFELL